MILADANCRVGSVPSRWIGDWQSDPEDETGALLHALLAELDVWIPSTFEGVMQGAGGTLLQRCSGELQRSDYVGLPVAWQRFHTIAWVETAVTAGHSAPDHFAVVAQCTKALLDPENEDAIRGVIRSVPQLAWSTNVNEHAAVISEHLHQQLSALFPLQARRMRSSFLSEESAAVHQEIATLRHALRNRIAALTLARLRCAWIVWRDSTI